MYRNQLFDSSDHKYEDEIDGLNKFFEVKKEIQENVCMCEMFNHPIFLGFFDSIFKLKFIGMIYENHFVM